MERLVTTGGRARSDDVGIRNAAPGSEEHELHEGDHVCFLAGNPVPHHIENRSSSNLRFLVFGERIPGDTVFYPNGPVMMVKALGGALFTYQERGAAE